MLGVFHAGPVQRDDLVGDIGTGRRHLLARPDVALGDLDETAILGGRPYGRLDKPLIGQAVEHHVDTGAVGVGEDLVGEIRTARVVDIFHTQLAQCRAFVGARGGEDDRALPLRHLDRGQSDTTARGVNEHTLTRLQLRPVERESGRECRSGNGGRRNRAQPVGQRRHYVNRHIEPGGERAVHEAIDALADLESGDAIAQLRDGAGEVAAERARIARVEAQHIEHLPEVQATGLNPHLHTAGVGRRRFLLDQTQVVDCAAFSGRQNVIGCTGYREMTAARPWQ